MRQLSAIGEREREDRAETANRRDGLFDVKDRREIAAKTQYYCGFRAMDKFGIG